MSWPTGRHPTAEALTVEDVLAEPRAAPGTYPVPTGRGRWRLTVHSRQFSSSSNGSDRILAELTDARSRRLEQAWCDSATLTFSVDGHSPAAAQIAELQTDVVAWRWDDRNNRDVPLFRGVVAQSQDNISEQTHTVNFTCHDYLAMLGRRLLTGPATYTNVDQDNIAAFLINQASTQTYMSNGTSLNPGAYLPLTLTRVDPSGVSRALSGTTRVRAYDPQTAIGDAFDQLAKVAGGFDYDVLPALSFNGADQLRIFFPYQGVARSDLAYVYGSTVASVTRSVNSADYANYWRVIGEVPDGSPDGTPPIFSEAVNADANNVTVSPVGLWMSGDNQSDVSIQSTLDETALGNLGQSGILVPTYSLGLRPGIYSLGNPNMGDVVPLVIQSGRLNVVSYPPDAGVRVLGITYDIGDDGQEDVTLTVGRPLVKFSDLLVAQHRDVNALARR